MHVDGAFIGDFFGVAPQVFQQLFTAYGAGAVFHEEVQQLEFLEGQVQGFAIQVDFAAREVNQHTRWARGGWAGFSARPAGNRRVTQCLANNIDWFALRTGWCQRYGGVGLCLRRQGGQEGAHLGGKLAQRGALRLGCGFIQAYVEHEAAC